MRYYLALDIGASRLRAALVVFRNGEAKLVRRIERSTPRSPSGSVISQAIVELALEAAGNEKDRIVAIGVGSIGPLNLAAGEVSRAVNIPAKSFKIAGPLMEAFGKPVYVANDCMAAVWGEKMLGKGRQLLDIVYVTLSTGVGGGVVVDGNLLVGKRGNAHEIGHIVVDVSGFMECGCGGRGHWEAYSGGANIPRFARKYYEERSPRELRDTLAAMMAAEGKLTPIDLYSLARKGDRFAQLLVDEINKYNCAGLESIVNAYDPELVVLGGSIALNNPDLVFKPLRDCISKRDGIVTKAPRLELASFGDDAVLIGAAAIAYTPPDTLLRRLKYLRDYDYA
ncbi:MAG: ROK family protein [Pyrodictiaceae archaeon]